MVILSVIGIVALIVIALWIGICDIIAAEDQEEIVSIVLRIQGWTFIAGSLFFGLFSILDILKGAEVLL